MQIAALSRLSEAGPICKHAEAKHTYCERLWAAGKAHKGYLYLQPSVLEAHMQRWSGLGGQLAAVVRGAALACATKCAPRPAPTRPPAAATSARPECLRAVATCAICKGWSARRACPQGPGIWVGLAGARLRGEPLLAPIQRCVGWATMLRAPVLVS